MKLHLVLVACALVVASCGGSSSAPAGPAADRQIILSGVAFSPTTVSIKAGQTVQWVWQSGRHDVTSGSACTADGKFSSGAPKSDGDFIKKFDTPGEYPFFCTPHCVSAGMMGKVVVTP